MLVVTQKYMKLRYFPLLLSLLILSGCSETAYQTNYTVPTAQKEIAPIERQIQENSTQPVVNKAPVSPEKPVIKKVEEKKEVPLSNDNYYINSKGVEVHSPASAPSIPSGASARCADGTYSFSQSRRGTCSHHGGVAEWY
jgi:uncharacterized protein YcfL